MPNDVQLRSGGQLAVSIDVSHRRRWGSVNLIHHDGYGVACSSILLNEGYWWDTTITE